MTHRGEKDQTIVVPTRRALMTNEEKAREIHEADCPALCETKAPYYSCHQFHACTCSAPTAAQLAELVEAAEDRDNGRPGRYTQRVERLDAALVPFRGKR